jgi:succinate-acetate transporter protein
MAEHVTGRPGLGTSGEEAAWAALRERVIISLRPLGAPTPIGFLGLAAASLVLSGLQLGWIARSESPSVAMVLIAFVFVAQFVAALFSFLSRDGTAATAMATLALVWLVTGVVMLQSKPGATSATLGLFLLLAAAAMTLAALTAAMSKLVPAVVFLVAAARFLLTGVYHLVGAAAWKMSSGIVGLALFVLAMYAAWASELEDATGRTVLPLGRRSKGSVALHGSLLEQVSEVVHEPGVRQQL